MSLTPAMILSTMNRDELRRNIGQVFKFFPIPRRDSTIGSYESENNQWLLRRESSDKKSFEFLNMIGDYNPLVLDPVKIKNFDAPDILILRGQVILEGSNVRYEPSHPKPSSDTPPIFLTMFLEGFEDSPLPTFTSPSFQPFKFCVKNTSQQTVRDFRSTLYIPQAFKPPTLPLYLGKLSKIGESTINSTSYAIYETFAQSPIYGNDQVCIGELVLEVDPGNYTFLWKIRCADGTFPKENEYGEITVCVEPFGKIMDEAVTNLYKKQ